MVEYFTEKYLQHCLGSCDFINPSLDRVVSIYNFLKQDIEFKKYMDKVFSIVIAGTNGKGSSSSYLSILLSKLGIKVGLYTSPHLVEILERIQILNGKLKNEDVEKYIKDLVELYPSFKELSYFEKLTVIAVYSFFRQKTDINIYEVGMGGRWDATNVFPAEISVITSIGLDHTQYLGNTVDKIFLEKAAIIKGKYLFLGDLSNVSSLLLQKVKDESYSKGMKVFEYGSNYSIVDNTRFKINLDDSLNYECSFPKGVDTKPEVLKKNFILSFSIFLLILKEYRQTILSKKDIEELIDFNWSTDLSIELDSFKKHQMISCLKKIDSAIPVPIWGRYQLLTISSHLEEEKNKEKSILIDVCHNEAGALALYNRIQKEYKDKNSSIIKRPGIVSILKDKDYITVFNILKNIMNPIFVFQSSSDRSVRKENIEDLEKNIEGLSFYSCLDDLWKDCIDKYDNFIVCGSVYGVGEFLKYLNIYPNKIKDL